MYCTNTAWSTRGARVNVIRVPSNVKSRVAAASAPLVAVT